MSTRPDWTAQLKAHYGEYGSARPDPRDWSKARCFMVTIDALEADCDPGASSYVAEYASPDECHVHAYARGQSNACFVLVRDPDVAGQWLKDVLAHMGEDGHDYQHVEAIAEVERAEYEAAEKRRNSVSLRDLLPHIPRTA